MDKPAETPTDATPADMAALQQAIAEADDASKIIIPVWVVVFTQATKQQVQCFTDETEARQTVVDLFVQVNHNQARGALLIGQKPTIETHGQMWSIAGVATCCVHPSQVILDLGRKEKPEDKPEREVPTGTRST